MDAPTPRLDLGQSQHGAVHVPEGAQFCHALSRCTLQTKPQQAPGQRTRPSLAQAWSLPILPLSSSAHQLQPHFFVSHHPSSSSTPWGQAIPSTEATQVFCPPGSLPPQCVLGLCCRDTLWENPHLNMCRNPTLTGVPCCSITIIKS